ncbi:hypothetical protein J6590_075467 [Homalodisca vitripennis]|nr:hypothetical protein J6590_075467 [Homalodisca vitripennis]
MAMTLKLMVCLTKKEKRRQMTLYILEENAIDPTDLTALDPDEAGDDDATEAMDEAECIQEAGNQKPGASNVDNHIIIEVGLILVIKILNRQLLPKQVGFLQVLPPQLGLKENLAMENKVAKNLSVPRRLQVGLTLNEIGK